MPIIRQYKLKQLKSRLLAAQVPELDRVRPTSGDEVVLLFRVETDGINAVRVARPAVILDETGFDRR